MQYIDFCNKTASKRSTGRALGRLTQIHGQNPSVWIMSAKWEFEENANIDNARALMQKALRLNPESKILWLEYFRLELLHVDKIKKRKEFLSLTTEGDQVEKGEIPEQFLANKIASIVYKNAINEFPNDVDFRVEFLSIYRLFPDTKENQDQIYESLEKDFGDNEIANSTIARRPLDDLQAKTTAPSDVSDEDWKKAEDSCCGLFADALKKFNTGEFIKFQELKQQTFLSTVTSYKHGEARRLDCAPCDSAMS
ncbi:U3 small nucleolar RNA-associated protein 6 homolog [Rhopilema esculentum]|uniref:U3 small nucleolar RNA-associated protein 6 homolog n=1 Tax=Rhopilema esculentum TaxID=499914 RepID=UPI0031E20B29